MVIRLGGLPGRAELVVGVRNRQIGLLHGGIQQIALGERQPRNQRPLELPQRRIGPTDAEECLARIGAFQPHPLQERPRIRRALRLQQGEPQGEIGLVPERQQLLVRRGDPAHLVEMGDRLGQAAPAHQRNAEIELRIRGPVARPMPGAQRGDGVVVAPLPHHDLRQQHVALGVGAGLDLVRHLPQCALGLLEVAALVPNLPQIEPCLVAHRFRGAGIQQRREDLAGLDVLAQGQVQAAEQQFRLPLGVRQALPLLRRQQARDRIEEVVLIEIKEHVAIGEVLDVMGRQSVRIGLDVLGIRARPRQHQQRAAEGQRTEPMEQALRCHSRRHSQSLILNSGWCFVTRSVIFSSRYFAPTPFSKLMVAPRL